MMSSRITYLNFRHWWGQFDGRNRRKFDLPEKIANSRVLPQQWVQEGIVARVFVVHRKCGTIIVIEDDIFLGRQLCRIRGQHQSRRD